MIMLNGMSIHLQLQFAHAVQQFFQRNAQDIGQVV